MPVRDSSFDTMAKCEPSAAVREAIRSDLNIQGIESIPQDIDMRAVIPVYNLAPCRCLPIMPQVRIFTGEVEDLGGQLSGVIQPVFTNYPSPSGLLYSVVQSVLIFSSLDANARAALVAASKEVWFEWHLAPATVTLTTEIPLRKSMFYVNAAAFGAKFCLNLNDTMSTGKASDYQTAGEQPPYISGLIDTPLIIPRDYALSVRIYALGLANIPSAWNLEVRSQGIDYIRAYP